MALTLSAIWIAAARAGDVKVDAVMMTEPHGRELTAYTADARKLYAIFKTQGTKEGDNIRCAWIADDDMNTAPTIRNTESSSCQSVEK